MAAENELKSDVSNPVRVEYNLVAGTETLEGTSAMKATVFVEKVGKKKYRATTSQPIPLETEGTSQDQALERLYELAKKRLASGQLFHMNLPDASATNPWQTFAGIWKDHPEFDAFLENIAEYRRSVNRSDSSS